VLKPFADLVVRELCFWLHLHEQMEMIAHQAKAQHLSEIDRTEACSQ
jgi:hypothetical protein